MNSKARVPVRSSELAILILIELMIFLCMVKTFSVCFFIYFSFPLSIINLTYECLRRTSKRIEKEA